MAGAQGIRVDDSRKVEVAYLLNFLKYVQWPEPDTPDAPYRIAILGDVPFTAVLEEAVRGRKINGRAVEAIRTRDAKVAQNAHIAFFSASENNRWPDWMESLQGKAVLLVGAEDEFLEQGGMIALRRGRDRIDFAVNLQALESSGLKASSRMLEAAGKVIRTQAGGTP